MSKDKAMLNAFDPSRASELAEADRALVARRQQLLSPAYRLFYDEPLHIVRGEGVWLYDNTGRAYLDAYNNVASVGHCRPEVVDAIARQASVLNTHTRYLHEGVLNYAERLLATFPAPLSQAMFTCTGSEANDLALRIAKSYTKGTGVIITQLAYHGLTVAISELSPSLGDYVERGPQVKLVPAPDTYRIDGDVGAVFATGVRQALAQMKAEGIKPCALLVDGIFSSDGVFPGEPGFLKEAVAAVREAGGIYIADEVQPGFGRTGEHMWGFQRHGLVPDIVTLGKPMGNGQPIAGLLATADALAEFGKHSRYFNTFAGNTVSCAAALAVLETIERERLVPHAAKIGKLLLDGISGLAARHEAIGDVRGAGLFVGVELVSNRTTRAPDRGLTSRVVNLMRDKGVLLSACAQGHNVLKIRPPLVLSAEQAGMVIEALDESLAEAQRMPPA